MGILWKAAALAAVLAAASAAPAKADSFGLNFGSGGVSFSYDSGGYCDSFGCPDGYWDLPLYDCPVFWRGQWYRGPVYYRRHQGREFFWLHGDWRYDEWRGPRPSGACYGRYRPALGFEFYERNGFRIRDDWSRRWYRDHGRDWNNRYRFNERDRRDGDHRDWDRRDNNNRGNNWGPQNNGPRDGRDGGRGGNDRGNDRGNNWGPQNNGPRDGRDGGRGGNDRGNDRGNNPPNGGQQSGNPINPGGTAGRAFLPGAQRPAQQPAAQTPSSPPPAAQPSRGTLPGMTPPPRDAGAQGGPSDGNKDGKKGDHEGRGGRDDKNNPPN
jgi:hypothetical protein